MNDFPENHRCRDPFEVSLEALLSGDATERDHTILNDALRADPDARRVYIRTMAFEAMLASEFAPEEQAETPVRRRRWIAPLSIAAAVLLGSALAWRMFPRPSPGLVDDDGGEITHAVITSLDNASGNFGGAQISRGMRLPEGVLQLDSGIAEITFDTGAEVTLEAPARLRLESENKSRLEAGRASAVVPEQARGFVIHTPTSYIRDLGTAFAVEVRDASETDLHVLEGEVEVAATGRKAEKTPRILRQKEAVRLVGGGMEPISFRPDNPGAKREKRTPKIPPSVHWSFDSWDGLKTIDPDSGEVLRLQRKGGAPAPEIVDGPFGQALHLDGEGVFARSTYPGVGGSQPRTVACWVCLPPGDSGPAGAPNGIVGWGVNRSSGKWQIGWNSNSAQGNTGAPRVEFGTGYVTGATDLRDGRWHHLAVVYLGGPKPNIATHVRIYVDGKLEPLTGRRQQLVNTDTTSANSQPLTIGRNLGNWQGRGPFFFEGDIDEVHVFEGPLLPGQIVRLMNRNTLKAGRN